MTKWKPLAIAAAVSLGLMGCSPAANQSGHTGQAGVNTVNNNPRVNLADMRGFDRNATYNTTANSIYKPGSLPSAPGSRNFGYAEYSKSDMHSQQAATYHVDRNVLARAVSTVVTTIPGVDKSTVLVTDEDVFVGISGISSKSDLNKVKLAAFSVTPRYYKIYVTKDQNVTNEIKTLVAQNRVLHDAQLQSLLQKKTIDMTGTVTDTAPTKTNTNLNKTFPNTNATNPTNQHNGKVNQIGIPNQTDSNNQPNTLFKSGTRTNQQGRTTNPDGTTNVNHMGNDQTSTNYNR